MTRDRHRLLHIRDAIARIREYMTTWEEYSTDSKTQDAIIRNLEIIGEAVKMLDPETCAAEPQIPWSSFARMRDRLIHGYFSIDLELVWDTVDKDLGPLDAAVKRMLDMLANPVS